MKKVSKMIVFAASLMLLCACENVTNGKVDKYPDAPVLTKQLIETLKKYPEYRNFCQGRAAVMDANFRWGFIDTLGNEVVSCKFSEVRDYNDDVAAVNFQEKWGYVDMNGNLIVDCQYKYCEDFSEGIAAVANNRPLWGIIDKTGKEILPCKMFAGGECHDGLIPMRNILGWWGFFDKQGKEVIRCFYVDYHNFYEGVAAVKKKEQWKLIDKENNVVTELPYRIQAHENKNFDFHDGLALVQHGRFGYIDKTGKLIIDCKYRNANRFGNGHACAVSGKEEYIFDKTGKVLKTIPCYVESYFSNGVVVAKHDMFKYGYIDKDGDMIVPFVYDYAEPFSESGFGRVKLIVKEDREEREVYGLVDKHGNSTFEGKELELINQRLQCINDSIEF